MIRVCDATPTKVGNPLENPTIIGRDSSTLDRTINSVTQDVFSSGKWNDQSLGGFGKGQQRGTTQIALLVDWCRVAATNRLEKGRYEQAGIVRQVIRQRCYLLPGQTGVYLFRRRNGHHRIRILEGPPGTKSTTIIVGNNCFRQEKGDQKMEEKTR